MPKFFAFTAMVPDDKLHDAMTAFEMMGAAYQMSARPVPVEVSNAMLRQMGETVEPARAKAAPRQVEGPTRVKPKPKTRTARSDPRYADLHAGIDDFLRQHPRFTRLEFHDAMAKTAGGLSINYDGHIFRLQGKGLIRRVDKGTYERIGDEQPAPVS